MGVIVHIPMLNHDIFNTLWCFLGSTLNGKSRNVNKGDIKLADYLYIIETYNIPIKHRRRKAKLLLTTKSLPDLKSL